MEKFKSYLLPILFFILVFLLISCITFWSEFSFGDEIWNFQSTYKIYNGGINYSDTNVIITPIFFVFGNFILKIFGATLSAFRLYNVYICFAKIILIFLIFRKFGVNRVFSVLYTTIWLTFESTLIAGGANYNQLSLVMCLLGILWYITNYNHKLYHLGQGLLIFLVFFTKQTIGIYYAFGIVLFELLELGFCKDFFKNQFTKLATFLPCILISLIIMYFRGNLVPFIDLCFGSILEFGGSNFSFSKKNLTYILTMLLIIAFSIFLISKPKYISADIRKNIKFGLCLSIGLSFNMYPLINTYHIYMSLLFYFIVFIYSIDRVLINEIFTTKSQYYSFILIAFIILYGVFMKYTYNYITHYQYLGHFEEQNPYYCAAVRANSKKKVRKITDYISKKQKEGINVIVLSYEAAGFMVPLNLNNREFDLPFYGNLGYNGVEKTIEKISQMKNTEFLIFTDEKDCFYQEVDEIRDYIMNNFEQIDTILKYSIYSTN